MSGMATEGEILKFVRSRKYSPMTAEELAGRLDVPPSQREEFRRLVREIEFAGELVEVKKRRLADPERVDLVVGTLLCNPRGFGFLRPARERDGADRYVSGENMSSAMHGDLVVARMPPSLRPRPGPAGRKRERFRGRGQGAFEPEIKVVSVLRRARTEIVGTLRREGHVRVVIPDDPRLFRDVVVAQGDEGGAREDDKVAVRITVWPTRHISPAGEIIAVFGPRGQLDAERLSVVREFNLRLDFPPEVARAAEALPQQVEPPDLAVRQDLTGETIFTIDPPDARDFDDAVSLRRIAGGGWELGVHIADVSHYVPADGAIDLEARARGTSVYLPGQVLPMLPEKLSNGLCSLRPQEIRLTKTVRMKFAADGSLRGAEIFPSFIRSVRRFNYGEVQAVLDGGRLPEEEEPLAALLRTMNELAELLRQDRRARGMLEMDIPEAHILTDEKGSTTGVELRRADASHRLIEQFMLAANEAVANHLLRHKLPYIARAHDEPEEKAIAEFRDMARTLGHALPSPGTRQQIQRFLARAAGKPEAAVLNYLLLRSMKIATYVAEDKPHYAIAAPHYLHFTSPIRRYPDLLAHRILQESWSGRLREPERRAWWTQNLPAWAGRSTETERTADEAERAITTRRLLEFVAQRKEPMKALITAAENYGLRVQVCDYLLGGVVRMSSLSDGFYRVNRERGSLVGPGRREYKVGQTISVRVLRYDPFKHQIEFEVQSEK
jgi:ribonuclease R